MRKKHLETQFVRFIIEKYGKEPDFISKKDDEREDIETDEVLDDDEVESQPEPPKKKKSNTNEDDSIIDELLKEYKNLRNQYDKVYNKRK